VLVRNECPGLLFEAASIQRLFLVLHDLGEFNAPQGELSVAFLPATVHTQLHADYHDNPEPTDVITFQGDAATGMAGEICVSPGFAATYVREHGGEFAEELTLYLVHGWLHLCGLDDNDPAQRRQMRQGEATCMARIRETRTVPSFQMADT